MHSVDVYLRVRRAVMVNGMSVREASRVFGLHRDTVRKMLAYSAPPGYRRKGPPHRPKLEPFTGAIDRILEGDLRVPKKQRHTAKRIFERLRDEYGFDGQYTIVKDYVREHRRQTKELFVPLFHAPGLRPVRLRRGIGSDRRSGAQGLLLRHRPVPRRPQAFLDGHNSGFAFVGGVPQSVLYDNTKLAVAKVSGEGRRQRTGAFAGSVMHWPPSATNRQSHGLAAVRLPISNRSTCLELVRTAKRSPNIM